MGWINQELDAKLAADADQASPAGRLDAIRARQAKVAGELIAAEGVLAEAQAKNALSFQKRWTWQVEAAEQVVADLKRQQEILSKAETEAQARITDRSNASLQADWEAVSGPKTPKPKPLSDALGKVDAEFGANLQALIAAAAEQGITLGITSGLRTTERQAQLWKEALAKYGSAAEARKWVAPPGKSAHEKGMAADLSGSPAALAWAKANAGRFGVSFPLGNEPWHVESPEFRG
jgi:LAS superfamily LD-carboxypeptidase LdcB